ncbi:type VI secretion system Vgr family protein [Massilia sp. DD77]|uniref:type VI secretion system Vgr family protein n=1 Tax=Massilia sp. DD77 TaxID=3109349 RepID=UPI002FFD8A34
MSAFADPSLVQSVMAALSTWTQSTRLLRLHTPLGLDTLLAESLHGEEAIDARYLLRVSALSTDASLALKSLLGQPVLLELAAGPGMPDRHFHGHVTAAELTGANGGLARYVLHIEPWTAFLALGRDSRVFQDMSVPDIIDAVFGAWSGKGRLAPSWRIDALRSDYPLRSLATQYQESDLAFVQRLMAEEGLFAFFEHAGDTASPSFGAHTLVIADSNDAFKPNAQSAVRFTQPGAVMSADSVDRWRLESRLGTNAVALRSWDYRSRSPRITGASSAAKLDLASEDVPGVYAYPDRAHGERIAERQLQALEAAKEVHVGAGTVRSFVPGTTFTLADHGREDISGQDFLIVRVRHLAHNNLDAETSSRLVRQLGRDPVAALGAEELAGSLHASGARIAERPVYRNRFDAIRRSTPYRASRLDGHGRLLHPRPTVQGQQTAIVVGPAGMPVYTDRDHRIKVQFHWQRGAASHNRLDHPSPDGHAGAPANEQAGTWVRVATPLAPVAGANWGSHALPRVGQEVLVDFLDGNIDRPVVIGAVYNGAGAEDAQHNRVQAGAGAATGNANPWFPGKADGHAHPAALSGLKSQALADSASGGGAYSQLVFDDSPGQARAALQRHAKPHEGNAELNLGFLRHQSDNQRLDPAGFGAELKTQDSLALRAGRGLLISTEPGSTGAPLLDAAEAVMQVESTHAMQAALAETARKHKAVFADDPAPDQLPAVAALAHTAKVLGTSQSTAFSDAQLQLSSPAGIAAVTPASTIISAGATSSIGAAQDINFASQGNAFHSVRSGITLFTYGKATSTAKPNQETGIRLHAASGKFSSQSQSGPTRLTADKTLTVASVEKNVQVAAAKHVLLTAQGAWIKLEGGNIEIHGPGTMAFKASMKELAGPQSSSPELPALPQPGQVGNFLELNYRWDDMQPMVGAPYKVVFENGTSLAGKLDARGFARLENVPAGAALVSYGEDEREAQPRRQRKPNALLGAKPASDEEAQRLLEQYLAQEDAHYKENYFPDELDDLAAAMDDEAGDLDYDFHYDDYRYDDEDTTAQRQEERSYRELHEGEHDTDDADDAAGEQA